MNRASLTATLLSSLVLAGASLEAAVVDRQQVIEPTSRTIDEFGGRVVASDHGMFLAQGHRVSLDGSVLDDEPTPGSDGHAVAWRDGWLVVDPGLRLRVRHLRESGPGELIMTIPAHGAFHDAASVGGRLAILEIDVQDDYALWITVTNEHEVTYQTKLGRARGAKISRFGGGLLVISWDQEVGEGRLFPPSTWTLLASRLNADGYLQQTRVLETSGSDFRSALIASGEEKAVILSGGRSWVVDENLTPTLGLPFMPSPGPRVSLSPPLAMERGFLFPYAVHDNFGNKEYRARIIRFDGNHESDSAADPIVGGDRFGNHYLVARPWGDVAIAEGDPRHVVSSASRIRQRVHEGWTKLHTVVSGDVTLILLGQFSLDTFVRVDASGRAIDSEPQPQPFAITPEFVESLVVATPDGFAFATHVGFTTPFGYEIGLMRLTRRGGWIDPEPVRIASAEGARRFALHANGYNLMVAWMTREEIVWQLFTNDAAPIQGAPGRIQHPPPGRDVGPFSIGIAGTGVNRMVVVQEAACVIGTCRPDPVRFEALTIDGRGDALGPLTVVYGHASLQAIALADGTWALPFFDRTGTGDGVLHLSREGAILEKVLTPELSGVTYARKSTATGWTAILASPYRVVEVEGAATIRRVSGFSLPVLPPYWSVPRGFAAGDRLAFLDDSPQVGGVLVPWTGRLSTVDGDLAIGVTDLGRNGSLHHFGIIVRNESSLDATNVFVETDSRWDTPRHSLPVVGAGEAIRFNATVHVRQYSELNPQFFVLSDDVADTDPLDNLISYPDAEAELPKRRPTRM